MGCEFNLNVLPHVVLPTTHLWRFQRRWDDYPLSNSVPASFSWKPPFQSCHQPCMTKTAKAETDSSRNPPYHSLNGTAQRFEFV